MLGVLCERVSVVGGAVCVRQGVRDHLDKCIYNQVSSQLNDVQYGFQPSQNTEHDIPDKRLIMMYS